MSVAQLVRAAACGAAGRGGRARHSPSVKRRLIMINIRRAEADQCGGHRICTDSGIARAITPDNHEMLASDDLCGILLKCRGTSTHMC